MRGIFKLGRTYNMDVQRAWYYMYIMHFRNGYSHAGLKIGTNASLSAKYCTNLPAVVEKK